MILVAEIGLFIEEDEEWVRIRGFGIAWGKIDSDFAIVFQCCALELVSFYLARGNGGLFGEPGLRRSIGHFDEGGAEEFGGVNALIVDVPAVGVEGIGAGGGGNHGDDVHVEAIGDSLEARNIGSEGVLESRFFINEDGGVPHVSVRQTVHEVVIGSCRGIGKAKNHYVAGNWCVSPKKSQQHVVGIVGEGFDDGRAAFVNFQPKSVESSLLTRLDGRSESLDARAFEGGLGGSETNGQEEDFFKSDGEEAIDGLIVGGNFDTVGARAIGDESEFSWTGAESGATTFSARWSEGQEDKLLCARVETDLGEIAGIERDGEGLRFTGGEETVVGFCQSEFGVVGGRIDTERNQNQECEKREFFDGQHGAPSLPRRVQGSYSKFAGCGQ